MVILILEAHFSDNKSYSGGSSWTLGRSMDGARLLFWRIIWMVQDIYSGGSSGWYKIFVLKDHMDGTRLLFWRIIWMAQDFYSGGSYGWYKTVFLEDQIKED